MEQKKVSKVETKGSYMINLISFIDGNVESYTISSKNLFKLLRGRYQKGVYHPERLANSMPSYTSWEGLLDDERQWLLDFVEKGRKDSVFFDISDDITKYIMSKCDYSESSYNFIFEEVEEIYKWSLSDIETPLVIVECCVDRMKIIAKRLGLKVKITESKEMYADGYGGGYKRHTAKFTKKQSSISLA